MAFLNEVKLSGKANADAFRPSERGPWRITVAQGGTKKKDSDERWPKEFFDCICWPNRCEGPAGEVKHGDFVEIEGRLKQRKYQDKNGNDRSVIEIIAKTISIHPKQEKPLTPNYNLEITANDIPF
jgi:single-stranded DNA-binding protein